MGDRDATDIEVRLAHVREFAQTSPYYQAMGMEVAEIDDGRVVQSGRRLSFAELSITEESSDNLVARGSGTFVIERRQGEA